MPDKKHSILLGAAVTAVLSTSYLGFINCLCCAGVIVGALAAVWHYTSTNGLTLSAGQGAVIGVIVAVIGSAVSAVLNYVLIKMGIRSDLAVLQFVLDTWGDQMPPESYDQMVEQMEQAVTMGKAALQALIGIVVSGIFGAIGGAIGASVFKKGGDEPSVQ